MVLMVVVVVVVVVVILILVAAPVSDADAVAILQVGLRTFCAAVIAVGETVILLHPPLPLVGVSIAMERECQQNNSLANGYCG